MKELPHIECPQCKKAIPDEALRYLRKGYPIQCPQCMATFVPGEKRMRLFRWIRRVFIWMCVIALAVAGVCYYPSLTSFWDRAMSTEEIACTACGQPSPLCRACTGTGFARCPRCHGAGDYVVTRIVDKVTKAESLECPECKGAGKVKCTACTQRPTCTLCHGAGKVTSEAQWRRWFRQALSRLPGR